MAYPQKVFLRILFTKKKSILLSKQGVYTPCSKFKLFPNLMQAIGITRNGLPRWFVEKLRAKLKCLIWLLFGIFCGRAWAVIKNKKIRKKPEVHLTLHIIHYTTANSTVGICEFLRFGNTNFGYFSQFCSWNLGVWYIPIDQKLHFWLKFAHCVMLVKTLLLCMRCCCYKVQIGQTMNCELRLKKTLKSVCASFHIKKTLKIEFSCKKITLTSYRTAWSKGPYSVENQKDFVSNRNLWIEAYYCLVMMGVQFFFS